MCADTIQVFMPVCAIKDTNGFVGSAATLPCVTCAEVCAPKECSACPDVCAHQSYVVSAITGAHVWHPAFQHVHVLQDLC